MECKTEIEGRKEKEMRKSQHGDDLQRNTRREGKKRDRELKPKDKMKEYKKKEKEVKNEEIEGRGIQLRIIGKIR